MDTHPITPDDLRKIAADHPLRVAHDMAAGIMALAATAATEAKSTPHETAIGGPVGRIFAAAAELRSLGGPPA